MGDYDVMIPSGDAVALIQSHIDNICKSMQRNKEQYKVYQENFELRSIEYLAREDGLNSALIKLKKALVLLQ